MDQLNERTNWIEWTMVGNYTKSRHHHYFYTEVFYTENHHRHEKNRNMNYTKRSSPSSSSCKKKSQKTSSPFSIIFLNQVDLPLLISYLKLSIFADLLFPFWRFLLIFYLAQVNGKRRCKITHSALFLLSINQLH